MQKIRTCFLHIREKYRKTKQCFLDYRRRVWQDTGTILYWAAILLFSLCVGLMAGTFMRPVWVGVLLVFLLVVPLTIVCLWFVKKNIRLILRNGITEFLSWLLLWMVCVVMLLGDIPEEDLGGAVVFSLLLSLILAMLLKSLWALLHHKMRVKSVVAALTVTAILAAAGLMLLAGQGFHDTYIEAYRNLYVQQKAENGMTEPLTKQEQETFVEFMEPGSCTVLAASYGTGGTETLESETVNISRFAKNEGVDGFFKEKYQGYPLTEVPLSGIVWYPEEASNCPTLFIVHGNHNWITDSYLGYEYLGTYLASHGYVVVSVDENACNGLSNENDGRAVLLLENIRQLEKYNRQEDSPLYQKMDYDNLALAGHSRGGEAVAAACLFNDLAYYPDNGNRTFHYHFSIQSLIAIAPTCGQYRPSDRDVELEDVNYMIIHGANDQDVNLFMGMEQYENITFSGEKDCIKTSLYLAGANHGQFNSQWGKYDLIEPMNRVLNVENFLSEQEQQQVAKVFIRAFLDETLDGQQREDTEKEPLNEKEEKTAEKESLVDIQDQTVEKKQYGNLLTDCRRYEELLPETLYVQSYQTSDLTMLCDFEEDTRLETGTAQGVRIKAEHVDSWREDLLTFSSGDSRGNYAVVLKWKPKEGSGGEERSKENSNEAKQDKEDSDGREPAELCFSMPKQNLSEKFFQFDVMDLQEDFAKEEAELLKMEILLTDSEGNETVLDAGKYSVVYPAFLVRLNKLQYLWDAVEYKHQFQTVSIPIEAFVGVDKENICKIAIRFPGKEGKVAVDNVGIR